MVSSFSAICKKATTLFTSSSTGLLQTFSSSSPQKKHSQRRRSSQPIENSFLLRECNKPVSSSRVLTCLCVKPHIYQTLDNGAVRYLNQFFKNVSPTCYELNNNYNSSSINTKTIPPGTAAPRSRFSCLQILTDTSSSSDDDSSCCCCNPDNDDELQHQIQSEFLASHKTCQLEKTNSILNNLEKKNAHPYHQDKKTYHNNAKYYLHDEEVNPAINNNCSSVLRYKKKNANNLVSMPTSCCVNSTVQEKPITTTNKMVLTTKTNLQQIDNHKKKSKKYYSENTNQSKNACIRLMQKRNLDHLLFIRNEQVSMLDLRVSKSFRVPEWDTREENLWNLIYSREKEQYECLLGSPHIINQWSNCISKLLAVSGFDKWRKKGRFGIYTSEFEGFATGMTAQEELKLAKHADKNNLIFMQTRPQISASDSTTVSSCYSIEEEQQQPESDLVSLQCKKNNCTLSNGTYNQGLIASQRKNTINNNNSNNSNNNNNLSKRDCSPLIRQEIREALVQWMSKVVMAMKWKRSTFFIAVHCMDAYLAHVALGVWESCTLKKSAQIEECLPLLSTAALFLGVASEEEHRHTHRIKIFIKEVPKLLSVQQIFIQQLDILTCLNSGLSITRTPEDFIYYFLANMKRATKQTSISSLYSQLLLRSSSDDATVTASSSLVPLQLLIEWILVTATLVYEKGVYMELQASHLVAVCMTPALVLFRVHEKDDLLFFLQNLSTHVYKFLSLDVLILTLKQWLHVIKEIVFEVVNSGRYVMLKEFLYALTVFTLPQAPSL